MVIRTTEQWQTLFKQQKDSGISAAQFCRENNLCPKYFAKRKKDLNWPTDKSVKPKLVKLRKPKQNVGLQAVTLQCGELKLHINDSVSPLWLAQVIKALA